MKATVFAVVFLFLSVNSAHAQFGILKAKPKAWLVLTVAGEGTSLTDAVLTKEGIQNGARELDPLARPFVKLPSPVYLSFAAAASAATSYSGLKMRNSRHRLIRDTWWLPQAAQIAANSWGISTWVRMGKICQREQACK